MRLILAGPLGQARRCGRCLRALSECRSLAMRYAYIHEIFKIVVQTSALSHFKDNFSLKKKFKYVYLLNEYFTLYGPLKSPNRTFGGKLAAMSYISF